MAVDPRELDAYRERIDRFIADLDQEYYDHFAGLKEDFDLESIYARVRGRHDARAGATHAGGGRRQLRLDRALALRVRGLPRRADAPGTRRARRELEARLKATVDGEEIPFRMLRPTIANSADRDRRERIERVRNELTEEHLNPVLLAAHEETHGATRELGASSYRELYDRFDYRLDDLAAQCRAFLDSTEALYEDAADRILRANVGVGLAEAQRWDVAASSAGRAGIRRSPRTMLPALEATLSELGIDLRAQENVHLDVEERPHKTPRAFCSPIEVPAR